MKKHNRVIAIFILAVASCGDNGKKNDGADHGDQARAPLTWTCTPLQWSDGQACNCGCGALDPDCATSSNTLIGCNGYREPTCNVSGHCIETSIVPDDWTCAAAHYASGDGCHCGCGAFDLDCNTPGSQIVGCSGFNQPVCTSHGECAEGELNVPPGWTCHANYYDNDDGCDCNCGAYDLDCDDPGASMYGCNAGETCDAQGQCVAACAPDCSGRQCGDDGCGGSCGLCSGTCDNLGQCDGVVCGPHSHANATNTACECDSGYIWDAGSSSCVSDGSGSGVDPSKTLNTLTTAELQQVCEWSIDQMGGPASVHDCGDGAEVTVGSYGECMSGYATLSCAVGLVDACYASATACSQFEDPACDPFWTCAFGG